MEIAFALIALAGTVVVGAAISRRVGVPAPLTLLVVGVVLSSLPFVPDVTLSSEVVLLGLLPPLLYAAAIRTSLVDFRRLRSPIFSLAVGLVLFTALGVGLVTWWLLPVPFAVAFALGAIVAPPDAVAATAVARQIGLPRRVVTVLEGESLFNDATALVSLRTAIAAFTAAGAVTVGSVTLDFAWAVVGGVGVGLVVALVIGFARRRAPEATVDTALSLIAPYAAYLPAEELHASGVLAVVTAGLLLGHRAPVLQSASSRLAERTNWASIQFLLENAVFLMIGLQARRILGEAAASSTGAGRAVAAVAAVLLTVLLLRPVWVLGAGLLKRLRPHGSNPQMWREHVIVSWAGMRGVVTLAAAFVLPPQTPARPVLVLTALSVAIGTILIQGLTLPYVARALGLRGPDAREDALQEAALTQRAVEAGLASLESVPNADPRTVEVLRSRAEDRVNRVWERLGPDEETTETPSETYRRLRLHTLAAEREELLAVRDAGVAEHAVLAHILEALDVEESMLDVRQEDEPRGDGALLVPVSLPGGICEHLRESGSVVQPSSTDGCEDCRREGLTWVHLRLCLACGHVGCCDSSVGRHSRRHFESSGHPVMRSFEAGEAWRWCFVDELLG